MNTLKKMLKKVLPKGAMNVYYKFVARAAGMIYGNPSRHMIIIGVTGTKGKSTTSNIIWRLFTDQGHKVGLTGTINTRIGEQDVLNTNKMTMTGRFGLQRMLRDMRRAGCDVAIVETTSEGVKQFRHIAIAYDIVAFTNLTPEHLESHGGFENYKQAKLDLFRHMAALPPKHIDGAPAPRATSANADSEHGADFLAVGDHAKTSVGSDAAHDVTIADIEETLSGTHFSMNGKQAYIPLLGAWNAENAAAAVGVGAAFGLSEDAMIASLAQVEPIPGRMEFIREGDSQDFNVIVDYAYEPVSLRLLFEFCRTIVGPDKNIITLISSTGGGRDVGRRGPNGAVAAELCDYVIVTDEDPYEDDPQEIIDMVAEGALGAGAREGENMWRVLDRTEAIHKAIAMAKPGDVVLTTAKGAEQKMCVAGNQKIDWDDRTICREAIRLRKIGN